jgi:hypothetical protein
MHPDIIHTTCRIYEHRQRPCAEPFHGFLSEIASGASPAGRCIQRSPGRLVFLRRRRRADCQLRRSERNTARSSKPRVETGREYVVESKSTMREAVAD